MADSFRRHRHARNSGKPTHAKGTVNEPTYHPRTSSRISLPGRLLAGKHEVAAAGPPARKTVTVTAAQAVTRTVPASFQETGTFVADETSDIAPLVAGRVVATPVNVGDFVKQGQVICELDHRDAQLRLDQARAALDQATAGVRQSQSRIGFNGQGNVRSRPRCPRWPPPAPPMESAQAQARSAAADAKRYENLVATGDVSRSAFEKARTAAGDRRRAGQCRPPAVRGRAQWRAPELGRRGELAGLARRHPRTARPGRKGARRHHHPRALRWLHHRPPGGRRRVRRAHQQDRHHRPHRHHEAPAADAGAAGRPRQSRHDRAWRASPPTRIAISPARSPPSIPPWTPTRASSSWKPGSTIPRANCGPACSPPRTSSCPAARPPSSCRATPSSATRPPIPSRSSPSTTTPPTCAWSSPATSRATRSASSTDSPATRPSPPAARASSSTAPRSGEVR